MAMIGMRHVVVSQLDGHTDGSEPTYKNSGKIAGGAISGNLNITRNDNDLHYDDVAGETDNGITAMSLELGLDDLLEDVQVYMLGTKTQGTGDDIVYVETSAAAPYVGIGYIRVRQKNGAIKYQAVWYYKVKFGMTTENSKTKGQSIEWQTPTITGKCVGISVDNSGDAAFRKKKVFDEESAAAAWLNNLAHYTAPAASATPAAS